MGEGLQKILEEQKRYYQARAAEYDQWFYRHGRYDYGAKHTKQWETEADFERQFDRVCTGNCCRYGHLDLGAYQKSEFGDGL